MVRPGIPVTRGFSMPFSDICDAFFFVQTLMKESEKVLSESFVF